MASPQVFPFTALVEQEAMKTALALNALNPGIGGVLIRGEKGTAKSTAVRAFARLLPELSVTEGCPYACDPAEDHPCPHCDPLRAQGTRLTAVRRPVRVVELPVGATEDRVIGTLDLERAIKDGDRIFEPGLLAAANRGILYVDEVNLLSDHLVDALLDAAAMGYNYVEREGISVTHSARFILVGTMNPEEGDLRPQLLDRFGLAVTVTGLDDPQQRAEVVRRRIAFEQDPAGFAARWRQEESAQRGRIIAGQQRLSQVAVPEPMLERITRMCTELGVDGLRGDIVMYKAAQALAAYADRLEVTADDVAQAARLALAHRLRRQPFDRPEQHTERLEQAIGETYPERPPNEAADEAEANGSPPPEQVFDAHLPASVRTLNLHDTQRPRARLESRRGAARQETGRGRYIRSRPSIGELTAGNLALDATVRAAAPLQTLRRAATPEGPALRLLPTDLQEKVREQRAGHLILFVVDASGSMAAQQRMAAVKGAVLALLLDAYQKRDRIGLVSFRGAGAELLLPPTNSIDLAEQRLRRLPTGGRTPLGHALRLSADTFRRHTGLGIPWLVLMTDGRPNVAASDAGALEDALRTAALVREQGVKSLVIDTESGPVRLGLNRRIAQALGGEYTRLEEITSGHVERTLRQRLSGHGLSEDARA